MSIELSPMVPPGFEKSSMDGVEMNVDFGPAWDEEASWLEVPEPAIEIEFREAG